MVDMPFIAKNQAMSLSVIFFLNCSEPFVIISPPPHEDVIFSYVLHFRKILGCYPSMVEILSWFCALSSLFIG
jgi:hypothetical protein